MYGIKVVTLKTGLSSPVVRMWEKHYNTVKPKRAQTSPRIYDDQHLFYLAELTQCEYSIAQMIHLSDSHLEKLYDATESPLLGAAPIPILIGSAESEHYQQTITDLKLTRLQTMDKL